MAFMSQYWSIPCPEELLDPDKLVNSLYLENVWETRSEEPRELERLGAVAEQTNPAPVGLQHSDTTLFRYSARIIVNNIDTKLQSQPCLQRREVCMMKIIWVNCG